MSRRRVKPDELDLWNQVASTTERLAPLRRSLIVDAPLQEAPKKREAKPIAPFSLGALPTSTREMRDVLPALSERLRSAPVKMDAKSYKTMQRGKLKPEGRIDLHGMTVAQAHPALISFIMTAQANGRRLVLVITGKGGKREELGAIAPQRMGALKRQVPIWLTMAPVSSAVLQVTESHIKHGGAGAYYVYLRRAR
ncbi:MAG: Smr/MutS family protein [Planktotalea sp.]|jgi:DNA-nicking Smr family endonuclease|uniref:Smr/MutS family protein n=1 Tax=Planktotalea sp. TaxID=2029877 RepID=UPI0002F4EE77|nr:Smr/MutS family protein [Planktotalea sp.]MDG1077382.1 Smr/MutS family protein [Planktotalea sp.]HCW85751.1 DNA mismatch repair protein MutS [Paracoccaceae bacterium]